MVDIDLYQKKLDSMRKNKESVPFEILVTKYAKPYEALKQELASMTEGLLQESVLAGIRIRRSDREIRFTEIRRVIQESGVLPRISQAILKEQDFETILNLVFELKGIVTRWYIELEEQELV